MSVAQTAAQPSAVSEDALLSAREAWALVGSQPLAQLSNMALLPSLGAMRADLNLSYGELGIVVASFGFARLAMDLPAGSLARRWNPRSVLLSAFAISAVASSLGLVAANAWQIATVRFGVGIASSAAQAMILAWLVGGTGRAARGRIMARSEAFFSIAGLIIPSLGGLLAEPLGWRVAFLLGAIAAAIGFVAVLILTRPTSAVRSVGLEPSEVLAQRSADRQRAHVDPLDATQQALTTATDAARFDAPQQPSTTATDADPLDARQQALTTATDADASQRQSTTAAAAPLTRSRPTIAQAVASTWRDLRAGGSVLLCAYIVTFVVFFCRNGLLNAVLPVMGADRFGIRPAEIGVLFSCMNALSIVVVLLGGRIGDRFGRYKMLGPGLAILLACQLALFVVHDAFTYVVIGLLQALCFFVNALPPSLLGDTLPPRARPQAIGVYRAVSDVALLSAPAIMGASLQAGGFAAAELASVAIIALALLAVVLISITHPTPEN